MTPAEKIVIAQVVEESPFNIVSDDRIAKLADALDHPKPAIKSVIAKAREQFEADALEYVNIHKQSAQLALADGDYDTARKAAAFAMEKVSAVNDRGERETIIDRIESTSSQPRIQIGIALGGLPTAPGQRTITAG